MTNLTVDEVAEKLHFSSRRVRDLLKEGKLKGWKVGRKWLIPEEAVSPFAGLPTSSRGDETGKAQHSLAELTHFADVRRYFERWGDVLGGWNLDYLWGALVKGEQAPFVKSIENQDCFLMLRGHLVEPVLASAFWDWWGELKKAATPFEDTLENLWRDISEETRQFTGLALLPWRKPEPEEGVTADFFTTILDEQRDCPALKEAAYSSGSVTFEKDARVWTSVEEGIRRLRGEPPSSVGLVTMLVSGPMRVVPSDNVRLVEKLPTPIEQPLEVLFYLRYGHDDLAFVRSPGQLPGVEQEHRRLRGAYGPKLRELLRQEKRIRNLVSEFRDQLRIKTSEVRDGFPGHCPFCRP